ncbi:MAG TPA: preprotein translocase subunit SecG [Dehalococcoidia bacterium]|nr:preprotein translocase subunit SecG [Dehalococcoidia bacterium]
MPSFLLIAQLLLAVALIAVILIQVKGGGLGGIFGQPDSVYRTRRGLEKTLLQVTIVLIVLFVILSIVIVRVSIV